MRNVLRKPIITAFIVILAAIGTLGQERSITRDNFWDLMRLSKAATKDGSYRTTVTIFHADDPEGPWELYSSWISDSVFPDRSRLLYTHRSNEEIVRIGRLVYRREAGGPWRRTEAEKPIVITSPAEIFGYSITAQFLLFESNQDLMEPEATLIRIAQKADFVKDKTRNTKTTSYWLDSQGVLVRSQSTVLNESTVFGVPKWQRRTESYEYNADIRVEAPIN